MSEKPIEKQEKKNRVHFYMADTILEQIDANIPLAKCNSRNEFVNKAIQFYNFYLHNQNDTDLLCKFVTEIVSATIKNTENRLARMDFKVAVELAKITHMIAPLCEMDKTQLDRLHSLMTLHAARSIGSGLIQC